jgi:RHS repeat-associated protein
MIDEVGLVNMNGRVYDPAISRFLSADPTIQAPGDLQSYNRYTYVMNSPTGGVDPTGYNWASRWRHSLHEMSLFPSPQHVNNAIHDSPGQAAIDHYIMQNQWAYQLGFSISSVVTSACGGCGGAAWQPYYTYQATGSAYKAGRAGAITYAASEASSYIPTDWSPVAQFAAEKAIDGAARVASGGHFWEGVRGSFKLDPIGALVKTGWGIYQEDFDYESADLTNSLNSAPEPDLEALGGNGANLLPDQEVLQRITETRAIVIDGVEYTPMTGTAPLPVTMGGAATEISYAAKLTRGSSNQLNVSLTQSVAIENLAANGYAKSLSQDGTVTVMTKGDKVYRFYPKSTGSGLSGAKAGGPSASVSIGDDIIAKLRFLTGN